jgi:hypothetical protein
MVSRLAHLLHLKLSLRQRSDSARCTLTRAGSNWQPSANTPLPLLLLLLLLLLLSTPDKSHAALPATSRAAPPLLLTARPHRVCSLSQHHHSTAPHACWHLPSRTR